MRLFVVRITIPIFLAFALTAFASTPPQDVPRALNTEPAEGVVRIEPTEQWRAGGLDDESNFFGVVYRAAAGDDGNIYLLDMQLATVHVYDADGAFIGTLGREGDGPGEFRFPSNLLLLPDGRIGVTVGMGGTDGDGTDEDDGTGDADPLEVICFDTRL